MATGKDTVTDEIDVRDTLCFLCVSLKEQLPNAGHGCPTPPPPSSVVTPTPLHPAAQRPVELQKPTSSALVRI